MKKKNGKEKEKKGRMNYPPLTMFRIVEVRDGDSL